jgi:hypothetical protein
MKHENIQNLVASAWLLYIVFDPTYATETDSMLLFVVGWSITIWASVQWGHSLNSNLYVKVATASISAFAALITFVLLTDMTWNLLPVTNKLYQVILYTATHSMIASALAAALIAIPLTVVFRKTQLLVAFAVAIPLLLLELDGIINAKSIVTSALTTFDVIFLVFAIWYGCRIARKWLSLNVDRATA